MARMARCDDGSRYGSISGSVVPYRDNFFAALNSAVFSDGSAFTGDDLNAINNVANVETVAVNDILLDTPLYIEKEDTF